MLIDWFTVLAQVANFLVLVWILKRFLYRPILNAIDRRDQQVVLALASATALAASAQAKGVEWDAKQHQLDVQREALMQTATAQARAEHDRLVAETRTLCAQQEKDALAQRREADARHDREIAQQAQDQAFAISRKALRELATSSLEAAMTEVFISRIKSLDATAQTTLAGALQRAAGSVHVATRFPLSPTQHQTIAQALGEIKKAPVAPLFADAPESLGGIEVSMPDYRMSWSLDGFLTSLSQQVAARAQAQPSAGDTAAPASAMPKASSP
jgi:F-type H+-transporting ATPase subunit b